MAGVNYSDANFREFRTWAMIYRSSDDSCWIAHTVNYNLMAWGETPAEARSELEQVFEEAILDDLNSGFDSARRPNAPDDVQQRLVRLQNIGRAVDLSVPDIAEREQVKEFASPRIRVFRGIGMAAPPGLRTLQYGHPQVAA